MQEERQRTGEGIGHPSAVPEGMEAREIPAGRYAVFVHKGILDALGETMNFKGAQSPPAADPEPSCDPASGGCGGAGFLAVLRTGFGPPGMKF